jgi:UDP-N-acetylmuramyl pentapeptide synthase
LLWPVAERISRVYRRTLVRRVRIVAVVGSVGKTTTMRTVHAALGLPVSRAAFLNSNSNIATGRALLRLRPWQKRAVLELGIATFGEMRAFGSSVRPQVAVVTAVAGDHWRSFKTLEVTRNEKADIVRALPRNGVAVLNADDPNVRWMATQTRARVILAGEAADAEIRATDVQLDWPNGMRFTLTVAGESRPMTTRLVGRHMVFAVLSAVAVALVEGVTLDDAIAAVEQVEPTPGRMQTMALQSGAFALRDEFKATEDSFAAALATVSEIPAKRRIAVIGEIAEETGQQAYRRVGKQSAFMDRVIFVGSSKNLGTFRAAATSAGLERESIGRVHNAREATELLRGELGPGDVLFIKGRWQQALGRVALDLYGRDVKCRADPCPFKRMLCDICPFLEQDFAGLGIADDEASAVGRKLVS